MSGNPVEWTDQYALSDENPSPTPPSANAEPPKFANYHSRIADLIPHSRVLPPGTHPFPAARVTRNSNLTFNIADYQRQLLTDFLIEGGRLERLELHSPSELGQLTQKVIINATGYGARELWKDESIVPVRGQIAWLIPQPEVNYSVQYRHIYMLSRRDGIVVQDIGNSEMAGYNDTNEQPDRPTADAAVQVLADLYSKMKY
jgi:glycine/D-amino acid oxidase-like deaminating enzyme